MPGSRSALTLLAIVAAGAAVTACGSSISSARSSAVAGSGSSQYTAALRYSTMRSHGVPKFPDPSTGGGLLLRAGPGTGLDPKSPAFASAAQACKSLEPGGGVPHPLSASRREALLKYSACMRSHGLPGFPDPIFSGNGAQLRLTPSSGISPGSPAFEAAQTACGSVLQKLVRGIGVPG